MEDKNRIIEAAKVRPSQKQYEWQKLEFYSFVHFTVNSFTDREWGLGTEDPGIFNPSELDAGQWVSACTSAGMKGLILTCKHHDGFCLWPSAYTEHSVKNSPWKNGTGDVVKEVAQACAKGGIKFGIYVSPWDRHEKTYGDSERYNDYFVKQLTELLTQYGEIFCVWFDGACGEGPNGKKQIYDWQRYYDTINKLQPGAVISVCGPDVRWCGNEAGVCRTSEWSVIPVRNIDTDEIMDKSQKEDHPDVLNRINFQDQDLGSREKIHANDDELIWYPAEVNTSIRPGWFFHPSDNRKVKSLDELLKVYYGSVGGNGTFLLNIPPDKRGLFHENDVERLKELGTELRRRFEHNLAQNAEARASEVMSDQYPADAVLCEDPEHYWCPREGTEAADIVIDLKEEKVFDTAVLQENIVQGQRIERFNLECETGGQWETVYQGTVIGYKRIAEFKKTKSRYLRISIMASRYQPQLLNFKLFLCKA